MKPAFAHPLVSLGAILLTLSCGAAAESSHLRAETLDPPSTHGMLVVGEGPVFFSHLPMFHRPHDYQVLIEVTMTADGVDALAAYQADRLASGETVYTFEPERFSLNALAPVAADQPLKTLSGTLYRGHFERGGTPILEITATVVDLPHFRKFAANAVRPPSLTYVVFGGAGGKPLFLAHRIVKAPDFDHVLTGVTITPASTGVALPSLVGATVSFPGVADVPTKVLTANMAHKAKLVTAKGEILDVVVKASASPYLEISELSH